MNDQLSASDRRQDITARRPAEVYATPLVDILSTEESVVLHAEMAGVDKSGVEITVEDGNLVLVGHRLTSDVAGEPIYVERTPVDYRRVYELDPSIDTDRITARVVDGILTVTLPKTERLKPRRITLE